METEHEGFVAYGVYVSRIGSICESRLRENARGKTVCSDGTTASAVNPNTGKAAVAQKNQNGVTTTQTSTGGTAKTKNGSGVAQGPGGTTCAKTKNNAACKPK